MTDSDRLDYYRRLKFPEEITEKLIILSKSFNYDQYIDLIKKLTIPSDSKAAYLELKEILEDDSNNLKLLFYYLEASFRTYKIYRFLNIPDTIFINTLKALSRFLYEQKEISGTYRFSTGWWAYRHLNLTLFRIEELEFELTTYRDKKVISIHIPTDVTFSPKNVDEAIEKAKIFIKKFFPEYENKAFICSSWLLAPELKKFLKENSNILEFQKRFNILETKESSEFLEYLYKVDPTTTDFEKLPENTTLQRQVKEYLLDNGTISWTTGEIIR